MRIRVARWNRLARWGAKSREGVIRFAPSESGEGRMTLAAAGFTSSWEKSADAESALAAMTATAGQKPQRAESALVSSVSS